MGMKTVAEFVEDAVILDALCKMGVDYAQGYGIAKPQTIEELLKGVDVECACYLAQR